MYVLNVCMLVYTYVCVCVCVCVWGNVRARTQDPSRVTYILMRDAVVQGHRHTNRARRTRLSNSKRTTVVHNIAQHHQREKGVGVGIVQGKKKKPNSHLSVQETFQLLGSTTADRTIDLHTYVPTRGQEKGLKKIIHAHTYLCSHGTRCRENGGRKRELAIPPLPGFFIIAAAAAAA